VGTFPVCTDGTIRVSISAIDIEFITSNDGNSKELEHET